MKYEITTTCWYPFCRQRGVVPEDGMGFVVYSVKQCDLSDFAFLFRFNLETI